MFFEVRTAAKRHRFRGGGVAVCSTHSKPELAWFSRLKEAAVIYIQQYGIYGMVFEDVQHLMLLSLAVKFLFLLFC